MLNNFLIFMLVVIFVSLFIKAIFELYKECKTKQEMIFDRFIREQIRDYYNKKLKDKIKMECIGIIKKFHKEKNVRIIDEFELYAVSINIKDPHEFYKINREEEIKFKGHSGYDLIKESLKCGRKKKWQPETFELVKEKNIFNELQK